MSKILLLNGSPRGKKSTSAAMGNYMLDLIKEMKIDAKILTIRNQITTEEKVNIMLNEIKVADFIILLAPLYDDCQPYNVIKVQELIFENKMDLENKFFLPIINCGFGEPEHMTLGTIPIYKQFVSDVGFRWGGSLVIGGGEMLQGRYGKSLNEVGGFAKNVIAEFEKIIATINTEVIYPDTEIVLIPKFFYNWPFKQIFTSMNNTGWKKAAEKNGEKVDAKPFM